MGTMEVAAWALEYKRLCQTMHPMTALKATFPMREAAREMAKVVRFPVVKAAAPMAA